MFMQKIRLRLYGIVLLSALVRKARLLMQMNQLILMKIQ